MANKTVNQHYLPQLLLRGFAKEPGKKDSPVWVFRNGKQPFRTNPRNVGAERFFYADPDESSVEADLSKRETILGDVVAEIREKRQIPNGAEPALAELVGQLVGRTKNVRTGFAAAGEVVLKDALEKALTPDRIRRQAEEALRAEASKHGMSPSSLQVEMLVQQLAPQFSSWFEEQGGVERLRGGVDVAAAAKAGQVRSFETDPESVGKRFRELQWGLVTTAEMTLILGDVGPVALAQRKKKAKPGLFFSSRHDLIVLPVADSLAVVGGTLPFVPNEISVDRVNVAAAKLSREFFVARDSRPQEAQLHAILGRDLRLWETEPRKAYSKRMERMRERGEL